MNELTGAEAFVRMLQAFGVKHIFGLCGDTSLPFYDALYRLDHGITHILTRDERQAAYMADGYARVTGRVGVCEGPSGGGATYLLPGVVEANESSIPILGVTSDIGVGSRGRYALTEVDQQSLYRPLTAFNQVLNRGIDIPRVLRAAFTHMTRTRPGAAHIGLPFDVQKEPVDEAEIWADPTLGQFPARRFGPDPAAVAAAADLLLAAKAPLIVCGGGVVISGAEQVLAELAETLGAPVATTISGQGSIAENHRLAVGVVGSNGGVAQTRAIVDAADTIFFVSCRAGSVTTERWRHPVPGKVKVVHLDADAAVIGANYPTEVGLVSDARLGLAAILAEVRRQGGRKSGEGFDAARIARAKSEKFAAFQALAVSDETPIRPERVVADLRVVLPSDAVVVADPGTPCPYLSAYYEFQETGRHFISNRAHGALGYAMAAATGAAVGRPGAKVVAVMGDGSFGFTAGELETIVRLKLPITLIVISNAVYGWIKAGQKAGFNQRYFGVDFDRTDHARIAEAYGLRAWTVTDPRNLRSVLSQAVEAEGPTLVDILCQPLHDAHAPVSEWVA